MSPKEIHKLRRKFIMVSMFSFTVVILFIGALINASNYYVQVSEIYYSLNEILDKKNSIEDEYILKSELNEELTISELFSPVYQRNVFYVFTYDRDVNEISFIASKGNTYRDDLIRVKAHAIMDTDKMSGQNGMYFYQKEFLPNGDTELAILDCTYVIYSCERLLYASLAVGFLGLILTFMLVLIFSKKAIQPEIRNNENQIQFLTNVSHELKTPLAVIQSNAEMEEIMNGENEYTQSTIRQVNRMNGLIKSLVMITKTREKSSPDEVSNVNISSVAEETLSEFSAMASGENKTIEKAIDPDIVIKVEESDIRQLIMILIDNAIKYCDDNGTVTLSLTGIKRGKRNANLTVSNSYADGENVDTTKFFGRFYREDESHNIDTVGYGIGLNIAENIIEKYNGDIDAKWSDGVISFVCEI